MATATSTSAPVVYTPQRRVPPTQPQGVGGTAVYAGYIDDREKDSRLIGTRRYITYSGILANVIVAATSVRLFLNLCARPNWHLDPAGGKAEGSREAAQAAELLEPLIYDLDRPWTRVVRNSAMYLFYGFGVQERWIKKRADGSIGFADVAPRPQHTIDRWDIDESTGKINAFIQRSPVDWTDHLIERGRTVYLVDDVGTDSPAGMGLFRHIVKEAIRLERYLYLEGIGYETDLAGVPIIYAPKAEIEADPNIEDAKKTSMISALEDLAQNHIRSAQTGLVLDSAVYRGEGENQAPSGTRKWGVELLKGESTAHQHIHNAISRIDTTIARALGTEHIMLGSGPSGSRALSEDKTQMLRLTVDSVLGSIAEQYEMDLLKPLCRLNGIPDELCPTLRTDALQWADISVVTDALAQLAKAGSPLRPGDPAVNAIRGNIGLPDEPDIDLEMTEMALGNLRPGAMPPPPGAKPAAPTPTAPVDITEEDGTAPPTEGA